jgi:small GTP-binding protein
MIQKKVCMLGAFAVGKTSLVRRYVESMFSEDYQTTVGVKIDKKDLALDGRDITLVLWDLYGEDEFQKVRMSYLRGSAGYLLVVDGTRPSTLDTAMRLHESARDEVGPVPFLMLLNKTDLEGDWGLEEKGWRILRTSARTGERVEEAFHLLAREMVPTA